MNLTHLLSFVRFGRSRARAININDLREMETRLNMKVSGLGSVVTALESKVDKVLGEVTKLKADFEELKGHLEDADIPDEATAVLDRIGTKLDALDALNEDPPATTPTPEPTPGA